MELDGAERAEFLERECAGDEELRREVESLVASHEEQEAFLSAPAVEVVARRLAEEATLSINKQIGHHRIISLLGRGGMGEVYLAQDTRLSRKVALKLLPAEFTRDAGRVRRFEQEALAASALNHPNILTVFEISESNDLPYSQLKGRPEDLVARRHPLPPEFFQTHEPLCGIGALLILR